jgi:hypothetical protein
MNMQGFTIQEMAEKLKLTERAVYQRLRAAEIKPLTRQVLYPESALETIKKVSKGGRPRKNK